MLMIFNPPASKNTKTKSKNLLNSQFVNKVMGMINISEIKIYKNVKKNLPTQLNKTKQISTVYTLARIIQSKIFNNKQYTKTLDTNDILDNMNNLLVIAQHHHGHILTGDICIVQNNKCI